VSENLRRWHQASEFAQMTGVTVRALHHYDRLGLLKPSGRSRSGYRLYGERDFARLQQIVTLKFIGLPLKQIKDVLDRNHLDLTTALRLQREIIEQKRRGLELAARAISEVERALQSAPEPNWKAFAKIIEVINMQNDWEFAKKYYTDEQLRELASRATPEVLEKGQRDWAELIKEVEQAASEGIDPASDRAQALASRWAALVEAFTGGNPAIAESLKNLYADQANWPASAQKPYSDEVGAFIAKANEARKRKDGQ
jgi:MerR family transcriptional regulator, thiopeptide resistance regulator